MENVKSGGMELGDSAESSVLRPPAIILVEPQLGENIGQAARAMANFGLGELRLVAPRDGWPNEKAIAGASGAVSIIDNATVFSTIGDAIADLHFLGATTARIREMVKPVTTPENA
jgi:tRNA/rRNA methyltransferase